MELKEAIDKRHSVREFEAKPVPKEVLIDLINQASKAPSAKNEQPWKFYVIFSKNVRDSFAKIMSEEFNKLNNTKDEKLSSEIEKVALKFYKNMGDAPNLILVFKEKKENSPVYQDSNDIAGISCAIENLMLSAVEKGLGTCWVGTFKGRENDIKKVLKISAEEELVAGILIGYPKKGYKPLEREKKKFEDICRIIWINDKQRHDGRSQEVG